MFSIPPASLIVSVLLFRNEKCTLTWNETNEPKWKRIRNDLGHKRRLHKQMHKTDFHIQIAALNPRKTIYSDCFQ